jgi:Putative metallopeptidase
MKRILRGLVVIVAVVVVHPAGAQSPASTDLHNPKISIEYKEPKYLGIYQRVKARKILEGLDQLLSPLRLEHPLKLSIDQEGDICGGDYPNAYYSPDEHTVHICYNWFAMLEDEASVRRYNESEHFSVRTPGLMPGFTRGEVIVGGTVGVALHEIGHAIRHNLDIPRLGREEDTADQMAGFIMLQFGSEVAIPAIKGTINVWHHLQAVRLQRSGGIITVREQQDQHSVGLQRAYNFLCLAYGSPLRAAFEELAANWLPEARKGNCEYEYNTVKRAFDKTIMPRVDQALLKKVQAMQIFKPEDFK